MDSLFQTSKVEPLAKGVRLPLETGIVYYLSDGYIGHYTIADGARRLVFIYKPGDIFPYQSSQTKTANQQYAYIAMTNVMVKSVSRTVFNEQASNSAITPLLLDYLQGMTLLQFERIDNLQRYTVFERLLERLHFFAKRLGVKAGQKLYIDVPMSHTDLASSIGASRESVNRHMKHLEALGVISVSKQKITINSLAKLTALMQHPERATWPKWLLISVILSTPLLIARCSTSVA